MQYIEVKTQAELDLEVSKGSGVIVRAGFFIAWGSSHVVACGSSRVVARESSHVVARESSHVEAWGISHVEAWGSSHVVARESSHVEACGSSRVVARESSHVVARESSHVVARESSHVVARESSHVEAWGISHVEAWGSSHVVACGSSRVEAWESSHVVARESSHVVARESSHVVAWGDVFIRLYSALEIKASANVVIMKHGKAKKIVGGIKIQATKIKTARDWCNYYGAKIEKGFAILFKALDKDFKSPHGTFYTPGTKPEADDWDGGKQECGKGLHFSPSPSGAKSFNSNAVKFVACPIKLSEIAIHPKGMYPQKVKAKTVSKPCYEVDIHGKKI